MTPIPIATLSVDRVCLSTARLTDPHTSSPRFSRYDVGMMAIHDIAGKLGLGADDLFLHGSEIAKVRPSVRERRRQGKGVGRLVLVSAITPTAAGEGKTTTSIGLAQGLALRGESVCLALREPSLGPCFGIKGGGTGGGKCEVLPADRINLHFTGDFHAITTAHNLLAAILDNHVHFNDALRIDPRRVTWRRVLDVNDRALRNVVIGLAIMLFLQQS